MRSSSSQSRPKSARYAKGLTLIHILALVAALGLIGSWALSKLPNSVKHQQTPEVAAAYKDITDIMQGLDKYQKANGSYPTSEQGLMALVIKPQREPIPESWQTGGYVKRLPRDPWGNPYQYRVLNDKQVEVYSYGGKHPEEVSEQSLIVKTNG